MGFTYIFFLFVQENNDFLKKKKYENDILIIFDREDLERS